jgi:hypothetical protein
MATITQGDGAANENVGRDLRRGRVIRHQIHSGCGHNAYPSLDLASKIDLNQGERRVFLDLGTNRFNNNLTWFMRMYPCDFSEIHAFELNPQWLQKPSQGFDEEANLLWRAWSHAWQLGGTGSSLPSTLIDETPNTVAVIGEGPT